jgi:heme-degrading monooxygenase HmoA
MFARILEIAPKPETKDELLRTIRQEVLPILRKQPGFLELLPFAPEIPTEHMFSITLWAERRDAEKYATEAFPKVQQMLKPFVAMPVTVRMHTLETSVCRNFINALTSAA